MKQNPTTMIKCKFSNDVHKILEPRVGIKRSERWKQSNKVKFTDKQKIEMFDKIMELHNESSNELVNYFEEKRYKKDIHKQRVARGYKFKKKTTKEEYEKSLLVVQK
jgi:hypothetical protein